VRRTFATTAGDDVEMLDLGRDVLAFRRGPVTVVLNCGSAPVTLPDGQVLIASGPVDGTLPADTAVWLG
jgi:alpha-glucosidase